MPHGAHHNHASSQQSCVVPGIMRRRRHHASSQQLCVFAAIMRHGAHQNHASWRASSGRALSVLYHTRRATTTHYCSGSTVLCCTLPYSTILCRTKRTTTTRYPQPNLLHQFRGRSNHASWRCTSCVVTAIMRHGGAPVAWSQQSCVMAVHQLRGRSNHASWRCTSCVVAAIMRHGGHHQALHFPQRLAGRAGEIEGDNFTGGCGHHNASLRGDHGPNAACGLGNIAVQFSESLCVPKEEAPVQIAHNQPLVLEGDARDCGCVAAVRTAGAESKHGETFPSVDIPHPCGPVS